VNPVVDYPLHVKETIHHAEKVRIGQAAADLIKPQQTVILIPAHDRADRAQDPDRADSFPWTVITNALNIAYELAETEGISMIMIGGLLRRASSSFVGPRPNACCRPARGSSVSRGRWSASGGSFSTPDVLEAQLNQVMIRVANEVTVVADASKFGRRSLSLIAKSSVRNALLRCTGFG